MTLGTETSHNVEKSLDWLDNPSSQFSSAFRQVEGDDTGIVRPVYIDKVRLPNNLVLAPMAGVTDGSFRLLCSRLGSGYTVSELASAKAIVKSNPQTIHMIRFQGEPDPYGIQIFGSEPETMAEAARKIAELGICDIIDINMGCPVPKVVKTGAGSALMKTPELAAKIIKAVAAAIDIPVTVKYRIGWSEADINVKDFTKTVLDAGAKAVTIHARTRRAAYTGPAQWSYLEGIGEICGKVPFFANGDILETAHLKLLSETTGCSGFMMGRGVVGRPWAFSEFLGHTEFSPQIKFKIFKHHLIDMLMEHGPRAVALFRVHLFGYIKNHAQAARYRQILSAERDPNVVLRVGEAFFLKQPIESIISI